MLAAGELAYRQRQPPTLAQAFVREGRWELTGDDFRAGEHHGTLVEDGALRLSAGLAAGRYLSPPRSATFGFNALAVRWQADLPPGSAVRFQIRTSSDGVTWEEWQAVPRLTDGRVDLGDSVSSLIVTAGTWIQVQAELSAADPTFSPALQGLAVAYLDTSSGPTQADWQAQRNLTLESLSPSGIAQPAIVSRRDWGCPQPDGSPDWPPEYQAPQKIIIHHTVTQNGADPFATVRAIWYYHATTLGWGDIGYNYLVDQQGRVFEGRYGGNAVVAGHAFCFNWGSIGIALLGTFGNSSNPPSTSPPDAMRQGLVTLVAAKCFQFGIDPAGSGWFIDRNLMNVSGHRDANGGCGNGTACPGDSLYGLLPGVRSDAAERVRQAQPTPTPIPTPTPRPAAILVQPQGLTFLADRQTQPSPQSVMIANSGQVGFRWQVVSSAPSWLQLNPLQGQAGQGLTVAVLKDRVAEGNTVSATIVVAPDYNPNDRRSITVRFDYSAVSLKSRFFPFAAR